MDVLSLTISPNSTLNDCKTIWLNIDVILDLSSAGATIAVAKNVELLADLNRKHTIEGEPIFKIRMLHQEDNNK
ncbi:uncharacterized protein ASCRUDRAFT_8754 [Ascoidea rubescens DSM 1968]|uniref:Uncharacterized protein n=1 Tax=Ascoidea rubescens DSM 1968 TaxID=1344418 RepID=A0A1D2VGC6_9ASCO|nr:hypothetical protein ASCRUDRAFT_8754 [Ascoidea rubescens DSM 1968]ODV60553.1 hypothetical protein ASCRUDRAFT_8754 [Ascoidea rubescens DSM 1968]